jgi:DNA-directed RNA polymerase sigma subunit (sigma70/sigma32)
LDVSSQGALKSNFLEWEPDVLDPSMCALDYAGLKLEEIGRICNLTRERVRQIEAHAMHCLARKKEFTEFGEPPSGIRRVL